MSDPEEEIEYVVEQPEPCDIWDGGCTIFDPVQFAEDFNCYAAQMRDGGLFVLDKESRRWRNAEVEEKKKTPLKSVKDK